MSTADVLSARAAELAATWAAARVVLSHADARGVADGGGGGLAAALDVHGVGALGASLTDGERVELFDGDQSVVLTRHGASGALRISWTDGPTYEQRVALTAPLAVARGIKSAPPGPVPSAVSITPPVENGAPVDSPLAALADSGQALAVSAGRLFDLAALPADHRDGVVPAVSPAQLGDPSFCTDHQVKAPYVAGAMAGGIASVALVQAMANAGYLGFFGSGGLPIDRVESALGELSRSLGDRPWGCNLLHNPAEPAVEDRTVDLLLFHGCRRVSASAFMTLTPAVVRYRAAGLSRAADGTILEQNHIFAKVSRPEVAARFLAPAPKSLLDGLVAAGQISAEQAALAAEVPLARDITAEADSGGHTDQRPLPVLLPLLLQLRDQLTTKFGYDRPPRIGAAGGLGDPRSIHAAFAMGAAYVLTGSINQACVEAGTSEAVKAMLAEAGMADVATGPAPDMFELGAHVQVLSKGTMYAQRARRLYDLYRTYHGVDTLPPKLRERLEKRLFRRTIEDIWTDTRAYWAERDPAEVERAERDPKHHMALIFRWYLGMTSRWARTGTSDRVRDFQIWCGPSMGLFNAWAVGTPFAQLANRRVAAVADALLHGAAVRQRVLIAGALGVSIDGRGRVATR
jgi:trans-AT polyketide synthase/acyltransferase/oxidoreductase domain-containing protein